MADQFLNPQARPGHRPLEGAQKGRVLIVDDDETALMIAKDTLEDAGFVVHAARTGREAVEHFESGRYQLVMMDVMMPEMDGYEACRCIRNLPAGANTPIIMVTGLDDMDSINSAYEAGATEFITKPINWAIEVHRVRYMLRAADAMESLKERDAQLRQSQKMEAIGRLAGGIAHDFNNLLTVILSYADLAKQEVEDHSMVVNCLNEVRDAGQRAASLTRQLLAFSRKQMLQPKLINLNTQIGLMEKMLRRLIPINITITTRLQPDLCPVLADPGQMEQVIMNLVINACDAMSQGGELILETSNCSRGDGGFRSHWANQSLPFAMLAIRDTGVGMTPEVKARIFEPFFTTKEMGKGTGLGLSMVYGIVKQSNGHIVVQSEQGKGTTFRIYLPASSEKAEDSFQQVGAVLSSSGHELILVAEDEESVRRAVAASLERGGYRVLQAEDGLAALEMVQLHGPEISALVTDLVMPRMGGRELAEAVSRKFPHIRRIFVSGYTENQALERYMKENESAFLQKPFALDALNRTIREMLARK